jgi:hypothetical protein
LGSNALVKTTNHHLEPGVGIQLKLRRRPLGYFEPFFDLQFDQQLTTGTGSYRVLRIMRLKDPRWASLSTYQ